MAKASPKPRILFVDDADTYRDQFCRLYKEEYQVVGAASANQARASLAPPPDAVLLDLRLSGDDGNEEESLTLLRFLNRELPHVPVIVITAFADLKVAVNCIRLGAADFVRKDDSRQEIKARIEKALDAARDSRRLEILEREIATITSRRQLVGESSAMTTLKDKIAVAAASDLTVLVLGETGTGKELVARAIHAAGRRSREAFVAIDLTRLPASTIESELFGHEKGSFTDAHQRHVGYIERANHGVLFLDEIAELSNEVQTKLLRFLQERTFSRVGGSQEIPVDLQIVAGTNRDIREAIRQGLFREDLYYRLKVFQIRVPALRDRREDVGILARHFLAIYDGPKNGVSGFDSVVLEELAAHDWPGNVRELENTIKAAVAIAAHRKHPLIGKEDLPPTEESPRSPTPQSSATLSDGLRMREATPSSPGCKGLAQAVARYELELIQRALDECHGRKTQAWKRLGLNDRYALRRLVLRNFERFPALKDERSGFPRLVLAFLPDETE